MAASVAVVAAYLAGGLDWLELKTLDWRFLYANRASADPRLICIDIDDGSLAKVGRWPWPRDVQAGIISVLAELGAGAILYDVTLTEPEPLRTILPRQADLITDPIRINARDLILALPDQELRTAIADAGTVYLAFDYASGPARVAESLGRPDDQMQRWIKDWLDADPLRWRQPASHLYDQVLAALGRHPEGGGSAGPEAVAMALRAVLSREATILSSLGFSLSLWPVGDINPAYFPHARAARRCGFVVAEPDHDGVLRRMRLLVQYEGHVLPQLAFAVAFDQQRWPAIARWRQASSLGRRMFEVPGGSPRIQIDDQGRVLVPWLPQRDWTRQFGPHIPADALWQVCDRRQSLRHNDELIANVLSQLLEAGQLTEHRQYAEDLRQILRLEDELRQARYRDDSAAVDRLRKGLADYGRLRAEGESKLRVALTAPLAASVPAEAGASPALSELAWTLDRALAANADYRTELDQLLARLRRLVAGKICLVGYTATALADMTPIPTCERAPGIIAHANLLSGLLSGQAVGWTPTWLNALLALTLGAVATTASVRWSPRGAGAGVALAVAVYAGVAGWLSFYAWMCWVAVVPASLAAAGGYLVVALYRYFFVDRERRQLALALSQYTSPTLARRMAEDAALCRRAETREVTALFTDLANFTSISERIGAERTQRLLNRSLGCFSDVIMRHEGMVNKFLGDGVFAFWNPLIYPQPDHARRACQTAIDLLAALRELTRTGSGADEAYGELVLRIGVATGWAVVGPCGSERKYDYTCIGDSVNVAARLESANKFYGTRVLISGVTYQQAGPDFVVRPLGAVQVKGKSHAVAVYELLGRAGEVADDCLTYAERFGRAVAAFQSRRWSAAIELLEGCARSRPDDLAAAHYLEAARRYRTAEPPEDWNGAIELTVK